VVSLPFPKDAEPPSISGEDTNVQVDKP
jgi:hypothetical protein